MYRQTTKPPSKETEKEIMTLVVEIITRDDVSLEIATYIRNFLYAIWLLEEDNQYQEWLKQDYLIPAIKKIILKNADNNLLKLKINIATIEKIIQLIYKSIKANQVDFVEDMFAYNIENHIVSQASFLKIKYRIYATLAFTTLEHIQHRTTPGKYNTIVDALNNKRIDFLAKHMGPEEIIGTWSDKNTVNLSRLIRRRESFNRIISFSLCFLMLSFVTVTFIDLPIWINLLFSFVISIEIGNLLANNISNIIYYYGLHNAEDNNQDPHNPVDLTQLTILRSLLKALASLPEMFVEEKTKQSLALEKSHKPTKLQDSIAVSSSTFFNFETTKMPDKKVRRDKPNVDASISEKITTKLLTVEKTILSQTASVKYQWMLNDDFLHCEKTPIYPGLNDMYKIVELWTCNTKKQHLQKRHYIFWDKEKIINLFQKEQVMEMYEEFYRIGSLGRIANAENESGYKYLANNFELKSLGRRTGNYRIDFVEVSKTHVEEEGDKILHSALRLRTHF